MMECLPLRPQSRSLIQFLTQEDVDYVIYLFVLRMCIYEYVYLSRHTHAYISNVFTVYYTLYLNLASQVHGRQISQNLDLPQSRVGAVWMEDRRRDDGLEEENVRLFI